jgi:hypothetical protein
LGLSAFPRGRRPGHRDDGPRAAHGRSPRNIPWLARRR